MPRDTLAQIHAARDAARTQLLARAEQLRGEMTPEHLRRRLISDMKLRARQAAGEAIEIASDNRGLLAGVAALALGWLARRQINQGAKLAVAALAQWRAREPDPAGDE